MFHVERVVYDERYGLVVLSDEKNTYAVFIEEEDMDSAGECMSVRCNGDDIPYSPMEIRELFQQISEDDKIFIKRVIKMTVLERIAVVLSYFIF